MDLVKFRKYSFCPGQTVLSSDSSRLPRALFQGLHVVFVYTKVNESISVSSPRLLAPITSFLNPCDLFCYQLSLL